MIWAFWALLCAACVVVGLAVGFLDPSWDRYFWWKLIGFLALSLALAGAALVVGLMAS